MREARRPPRLLKMEDALDHLAAAIDHLDLAQDEVEDDNIAASLRGSRALLAHLYEMLVDNDNAAADREAVKVQAAMIEDPPVETRNVPLPPPAFSEGTCPTCGMYECHHDTPCPFCGAEGMNPCMTAGGYATSRPHADRRKATVAAAKAAQKQKDIEAGLLCAKCEMYNPCCCSVWCTACEAAPGKPCVSYTGPAPGNPQVRPHAARTKAMPDDE